jgi:hypothetical protein
MKVRLIDPHSMDLVDIQASIIITIICMLNMKGVKIKIKIKIKINKNLTIVTLKAMY